MRLKQRHKGVGLIELLIALVIISIGVLAVARLQIQMIQFNQQALSRTQANNLAHDMLDRLVADRSAALAGAYNRPLGGDSPSGNTLPDQELRNWLELIAATLPQGDGGIAVNGRVVEVRLQWDDSRDAEDPLTLVLATQL